MKKFLLSVSLVLFCIVAFTTTGWATPPSVQSRYLAFSNIQSTTAKVTFSRGNGAGRILVVESGGTPVWNDFITNYLTPLDGGDFSILTDANGNRNTAMGDADNYYSFDGKTYVVIDILTGTGQTSNLTELISGTTYNVFVFEYNISGNDADFKTTTGTNNPRSFTTFELTPPSGLSVSSWSEGGMLAWTTDGTNATGYLVSIYKGGAVVDGWDNVDIGKPSEKKYPIYGLTANTGYTVYIRSYDVHNNLSSQATVAFTTLTNPGFSAVAFNPSSGYVGIGGTVTATLTATNNQWGLTPVSTPTINGINATFTDNGDGTYTMVYTVATGNGCVLDAIEIDLPCNINLQDGNGIHFTSAYTGSGNAASAPGVDGGYPTAAITAPVADSWTNTAVTVISGTAGDAECSGVNKVEVAIWIDNDKNGAFSTGDYYWNGTDWTTATTEQWFTATTTDSWANWTYTISIAPPTTLFNKYYIQTRTTDFAGNVTTTGQATHKFYIYNNNEVWVDDDFTDAIEGFGYVYFKTINNGIGGVAASGKVNVAAGTYTENVVVNKAVNIKSVDGAATTIITAANTADYVVKITADYVILDGFTITGLANGSENMAAVITWGVDNCTIKNNILTGNYGDAINLHSVSSNYSDYNTVSNNNITGPEGTATYGIKIKGSHNTISENTIKNTDSPIHIWSYDATETASPDNNTISGNTISSDAGTTASHKYGIEIKTGKNNTVTNNTISGTQWAAIHLYTSDRMKTEADFDPRPNTNIISNNTITGGEVGIALLEGAHHNTISGNNISGTSITGILGALSRWPTDWTTSPSSYLVGAPQEYLQITNNTITGNTIDNCGHGVAMSYADNNTLTANTIKNNTFTGTGDISYHGINIAADFAGVYFDANSDANVVNNGNKIYGNTGGLKNANASYTINAENNWWGSASGPTHSTNPCGTGDAVSDNVDFSPWYYDEPMTTKNGLAVATIDAISDISTLNNTPIVIYAKVTYPTSGIDGFNSDVKVDGLVTSTTAFPEGAKIESIKYKTGSAWSDNLILAPYAIDGKTVVYLSDVLPTEPAMLKDMQGDIDEWEIVASGIAAPATYNLTFQAISFITRADDEGCNTVLGEEAFTVTLGSVTYSATLTPSCNMITLQSSATFPTINIDARVKNDSRISSVPALPEGTVIKCYVDVSGTWVPVGSDYVIPSGGTSSILLSTIVGLSAPFALAGESGKTETWKFEFSGENLAIPGGYSLTFSGIAVFDGTNDEYVYVTGTSNVTPYYQAPAFTTGAATTTGGTVVAGYYNSTNTGIDVTVPVPNNSLLTNGTIQVQISDDGTDWVNVATSGTHTIIAGDLGNSVSISLADGDLTSSPASGEFTEGGTIRFRAVITPATGGCATTGTASATTIIRDETAPTIGTTTITTPASGTCWKAGNNDIIWTSSNITDAHLGTNPIALAYSTDGVTGWTNIATGEANNGLYTWNVPNVNTNTAKVKLIVTDLAGNFAEQSSNEFKIDNTLPLLAITYPTSSTYTNGTQKVVFTVTEINPETTEAKIGTGDTWTTVATGSTSISSIAGWDVVTDGSTFTIYFRHKDCAGNIGTSSVSGVTKDVTAPTISDFQLDCDNAGATVTFSEGVYTNNDGTGNITSPTDLQLTRAHGNATLDGFTLTHTAGGTTADLSITWSGTFDGNEDPQIAVSSPNAIFDKAGNAMVSPTSMIDYTNIPVVINSNPADKTICIGGATTFSGSGSGGYGTSMKWQVSTDGGTTWEDVNNGGIYSGSTTGTLTLTGVTADYNNYKYRLYVYNQCYNGTTNVATLSVTAPSLSDPADQNACYGAVNNTFTAIATGGGPFTFTWEYNNDGTWAPVANGTPTGATYTITGSGSTSNLKIEGTTIPAGVYYYRVSVSTGCGLAGPQTFTLTVNALPTITLGSNPSVCQGATSANLTYSATTGTDYKINFDATAEGQGFVDVPYTTLPNSPIVITVPGAAAAGTYYATLQVKNTASGCESNVYNISVTVNALPTITLGDNPSVCQGATSANLTYSATTGGANQYKIDFNDAANTAGFADVAYTALGASPISITVPGSAVAGTYNATLQVKNTASGCESVGYAISVTVNALPTATLTATTQNVCYGGTATYSVALTGTSPWALKYWNGTAEQTVSDITSSPCTITINNAIADLSYYITEVSDAHCTNTTDGSSVLINVYEQFSAGGINIEGETICSGGDPGEIGSTTPASGGDNSITYSWRSSADGYTNAISGATSATYKPAGPLTATTTYRRYANDGTCNTTPIQSAGTWTVTVEQPAVAPTITPSPAAGTICEGALVSATFSGGSGGNGTNTYEYRTKTGGTWSDWSTYTSGNTISTTGKTGVEIRAIRGATKCTTAENTVSWTVGAGLTLVCSSNTPVCQDGTLNLTVTVSGGSGNYSYVWTGPNSFLSSAQNPTRANMQSVDAGNYIVTVTDNNGGCFASCTTNVAVITKPSITTQPVDTTIVVGTSSGSVFTTTVSNATSYQWYRDDDGTGYNGTAVSGQTAKDFTLSSAVTFDNDGKYYLAATNNCGTTNSNYVRMKVVPTQSNSIVLVTRTSNSIQLRWTRGNGDGVLVTALAGATNTSNPSDGTTYTANSIYGSGDLVGTAYAVYNGTGTSVNVTGLTRNSKYTFRLFDYTDNPLLGLIYNISTATNNPRSLSTLPKEPSENTIVGERLTMGPIQPNPVVNENIDFTVYSPTSGKADIQLYGSDGSLVASFETELAEGENQITIIPANLPNLISSGMYVIRVIGLGESLQQSFIYLH